MPRGEKRREACASASARDGERRRSPRFAFANSSSDGECSKQSKTNLIVAPCSGAYTSTSANAKEATSKGFFHLVNRNGASDDDYGLSPSSSTMPQPIEHKLKHSPGLLELPKCSEECSGAPYHRHEHSVDDESCLPEKRILELVLDVLQRRDTHDIFSEPVDPSEVEEYYEIIKEPMDFGTMRAKLHEGMYKNLQQFERDIFLIFHNAMHFNSSATVYYRQGRALEDLAKKVFHVLKTDLENFELEFSATRRRSCRRLDGEHRASTFGPCRKLARNLRSNSMNTDIEQKGCRRQGRAHMTGLDRRCTYKPWMFLLDETDSTISPICNGTEPLIHVNKDDTGYKESLMLFVKDLGPTAHRVAKRKLEGLWMQTSISPRIHSREGSSTANVQTPTSSSLFRQPNPSICGIMPTTSDISHLPIDTKKSHKIQQQTDVRMSKETPSDENKVKTFSSSSLRENVAPTSCRTTVCALRNQGNMRKSTAANTSWVKFQHNASVSQSGADIDLRATTATRENGTLKWTNMLNNGAMLNNHVNTMPPNSAEESKHIQVGKFDLNQVQAMPSSNHLMSYFRDDYLEDQVTPYGSLGTSKLSCLSPAYHASVYQNMNITPPLISGPFISKLPFLNSRPNPLENSPIKEAGINRLPAGLQLGSGTNWPLSSKMSFNQASTYHGYTNQDECYLNNRHTWPLQNTPQAKLTLEL